MVGIVWWKQEKEYKDALDAFNEKNNEKVQCISKLMEVSSSFLLQFLFFYLINYSFRLLNSVLFVDGW